AVQLQVNVSGQDEEGNREISIHSRPQGSAEDEEAPEWTTHASGTLSAEAKASPEPLTTWPPEGAEPIGLDDVYEQLAEAGLEYGPAFQGLTAAWRAGEEIYAEVALSQEQRGDARQFGLHPALADAALHAVWFARAQEVEPDAALMLPFSWGEVALRTGGLSELRVRAREDGDGMSLRLADRDGVAVAQVGSLQVRPVSPEQLTGLKRSAERLFDLTWRQVALGASSSLSLDSGLAVLGDDGLESAAVLREAGLRPDVYNDLVALRADLDDGATAPGIALWHCEQSAEPSNVPTASGALAVQALRVVQEWLEDERLSQARLTFVTRRAVSIRGESPELGAAALWGLLRSAQSEHPGRIGLVDVDDSQSSLLALPAVLAMEEEPQLALREGVAFVPRVVRMPPPEPDGVSPVIDPDKTIMITGGTGGLGALLARHLVAGHGARHLLLVSRSGGAAEGAAGLEAELAGLGAAARIEACDVSERDQLAALIESISDEHPLGAVIHAAGALADGVVGSLSEEQMRRVFAPKVDAAWNLHELTEDLDLSAFVLFSSVTGTFGSPGQANYAAANVFLDALAQHRHSNGLVATSMAWGLWEQERGMSSGLSEADLGRMSRAGIAALSGEQGLSLFDAALGADRPLVLPLRLDLAGLRAQA
ncbi:MAG TPA: SDR family oxidoreductase, partial [Solirubrobacterales bacterium]